MFIFTRDFELDALLRICLSENIKIHVHMENEETFIQKKMLAVNNTAQCGVYHRLDGHRCIQHHSAYWKPDWKTNSNPHGYK